MTLGNRTLRWLCGGAAVCTLATGLSTFPGQQSDAARADAESDTQAQIAAINSQLDDLENAADEAGDQAVRAQSSASDAQAALEAATAQLAEYQSRIDVAQASADEARKNSAAAVQQLARGSGVDAEPAGQLITTDDPSSALWRLTTLGQVSQQSDGLLQAANQRASELRALTDQQQQVEAERERLTQQAADDAAQAGAASAQADAAVASLQSQQSELLQRLADIKRTTAAQEAEERRQRELAASIAASNEPAAAAQPAQSNQSGSNSAPQQTQPPTQSATPTQPATPAQPSTPSTPSVDTSSAAAKSYAQSRVSQLGWGNDQYVCLVNLWQKESGWRYDAENRSSGAYGIPQSLPGSKMASAGADWRTNPRTQIEWGLSYIRGRYSTPCGAWGHSQSVGWY